jgi:replicative DNA helicase
MWDFLTHDDTYDWIVPGLLERMDRLMLTGGEGGGKSVLLRQFAVTLAAGLHPFTHQPNEFGPAKVLVLDAENSAPQSRRRYRSLMNTAAALHHPVKRGQLHIDCKPEGVDLTSAIGRSWLMRRIETVMPDVLVIGPIYQLHAGDPNSEEQARKVTLALTEARLTARCALLMEAHAAKANGFGPRGLAPAGSSLWLRWPEFGFGLRPVEDERTAEEDRGRRLVPWRGMRDDRDFPQFLRQGNGHNVWPWITYRPIDADPFTGRSTTGATS